MLELMEHAFIESLLHAKIMLVRVETGRQKHRYHSENSHSSREGQLG